jgi:hypothetical protein
MQQYSAFCLISHRHSYRLCAHPLPPPPKSESGNSGAREILKKILKLGYMLRAMGGSHLATTLLLEQIRI